MHIINDLSKYPDPSDNIEYGMSDDDESTGARIVNNGFIEFYYGDDTSAVSMALLPKRARELADTIYKVLKEFDEN